jgi:hypothetical protein
LVSHFERGTQSEGFWNRLLRRIFGSEREEDRSWRKLHNDELDGLYFLPSIVRVINQGRRGRGTCGMHGEEKRCLQGFGWVARRGETTAKT